MYIINTNVLEILEQSTLDKDIHTLHTSEGDFSAQVKMTTQGSLYASNAVMLEVEIRGDHRDLKRKEITYTREIASEDVNDGTSETINYGTFVVLEVDYDISSEKTTLVCYDLMVKTQQEYDSELFTYPSTVHNLLLSLASACDLELDTNTYKGSNLPITSDVWVNVNYTYRDILNHIAQLTTNTIKMKGDKLHLFDYEDTGVQLNRFANLKIGEDYGPTNILNISYEPQRDNVFSPANANDIPKDERKELAFVNNPIFTGNEQSYADTLLPQLTDMTYATSEFKLYHGGIFQVGDMVEVYNGTRYVKTLITQQVLDSSNVQSEYVSSVPFTFKSEYVVETDQQRQGQTTYFLVDKQNGVIEGLVGRVTEVESQTATLTIEVDKIQTEVSQIHLGNIIPNLNMYDFDMTGWLGNGLTLYTLDAKFYKGLTYGATAYPIRVPEAMSDFGLSFFHSGELFSPFGYKVPKETFSWRGRVKNFAPFSITVYEYKSMTENSYKNTIFNFNLPQLVNELTLNLENDTQYVKIGVKVASASPSNRVIFYDMMFNAGVPRDWYESALDVMIYAQTTRTQLSNRITDVVEEVDKVTGDIHNTTVNITATDGVVIKNNNGKGLTILNDDDEKVIELDSSGNVISRGMTSINMYANNMTSVNMKAENITATGEINAISGKISDFTIQDGGIVGTDVGVRPNQIDIGNTTLRKASADDYELRIEGATLNLIPKPGHSSSISIDGTRVAQRFQTMGIYMPNAFGVTPPTNDSLSFLGGSSTRYGNIYLQNQPNVSSDTRHKFAIQEIPKDLIKVLYDIKPKMYLQGKEWHFGYIAQDVERALYRWATSKYGLEAKYCVDKFAVLHKSESMLSLLYGELAVLKEQYMLDKIEELSERLERLENDKSSTNK